MSKHHDLLNAVIELAGEVLLRSRPEDRMYIMLDFIKRHVPVDRIICYIADRKSRLMNVCVDFVNEVDNKPFAAEFLKTAPWDVIAHSLDNVDNNFVIGGTGIPLAYANVIKEDPFPYPLKVAITLHVDEKRSCSMTMMLLSAHPSAFTEEHRRYLMPLLPLLKKVSEPYFINSGPAPLTLNPSGKVNDSSVVRLRSCPGLKKLMRQVEVLAPVDTTVLIMGETGSGKELVGEVLHKLSHRKEHPFIRINCGGIPESLLESELFGSEKGAFTGSVGTKIGVFEQANKGTLFLDEVGELSLSAQQRLLRVLESHEIQRIGGARSIPLDIRIIAATHQDLEGKIREGTFREDLYYRLSAFPLRVPPLRERVQDIPVLADYYYKYYVRQLHVAEPPKLLHSTVRRLMELPWPGNVRQLRHAMEKALLQCQAFKTTIVRFEELDGMETPDAPSLKDKAIKARPPIMTAERIMDALEKTGWRIQGANGAAALLQLHPATLRSRMRALGIALPRDRK